MRRLALPAAFAVAVILSAPLVEQIRSAIRAVFPGQFRTIVGAVILVLVVAAIAGAVARIRRTGPKSSGLSYLLLGASIVVAIVYARATSTGNPEIDVVEHVHFLEYGVLALLFYRAWRDSGSGIRDPGSEVRRCDASIVLLPVLAGTLVGTIDEWFQWFIPARIGEARDVFLNGVAASCGLLFAFGFEPPDRLTVALGRRSVKQLAVWGACLLLVFALFFRTVHVGYEIHDAEIGTFRSRFTADGLRSAAREREARWRNRPPAILHRLSREDQYFSEGVWHVQRRNQTWSEGHRVAAWRENRILEKYYAPVLDTPSYVSTSGFRWSPEQRAEAERQAGADTRPYVSDAHPFPIYTW
jgi:VanZ family protein